MPQPGTHPMAEILIPYARAGRDCARRLANYLEDVRQAAGRWDGQLEKYA